MNRTNKASTNIHRQNKQSKSNIHRNKQSKYQHTQTEQVLLTYEQDPTELIHGRAYQTFTGHNGTIFFNCTVQKK